MVSGESPVEEEPLARRASAWLEGTLAMTDVPNRAERVIYLLGAVDVLADLGIITRDQATEWTGRCRPSS